MVNFASVLNTPVADVQRPPNVPVGTYRIRVAKQPELGNTPDERWDTVNVRVNLIEAMDDVDQEALEKFGGLGNNPMANVRISFMFSRDDSPESQAGNERAQYNMKTFFVDHLRVEGATLKELLANSVGAECLGTVRWRADKNDPEIQYAEIRKTAPL